MKTFTTHSYDMRDLEIEANKALGLPFEIEEIELEIQYDISEYRPATFDDPEEGGEIEDCNIKVIKINNFEPTEQQAKIIMDLIDDKEFREITTEWIWDDYKTQKKSDAQDLAEYRYDIMNDR